MKKKRLANGIMVFLIVMFAVLGILGVGHIRGWFDSPSEGVLLTDRVGLITLKREGVAYPVEEDTVLRPGDVLTLDNGGKARVRIGDGYLLLGSGAELTVADASPEGFSAHIAKGEVFCQSPERMTLGFEQETVALDHAAALFSVRTGTQSVSVLSGRVLDAGAGEQLDWLSGERTVSTLSIQSLNQFAIDCIRTAGDGASLCFTPADLDQLEADRLAAEQKELEALLNSTPTSGETTAPSEPETKPTDPTNPAPTEPPVKPTDPKPTEPPVKPTDPKPTEPPVKPTDPKPTDPPTAPTDPKPTDPPTAPTDPKPTDPPTAPTDPKPTDPPATKPEETHTCTITIRCDTILDNMGDLKPEKAGYVPSSGVILYPVTVEFTEGETVFDVLKRVCKTSGIQLEYSFTPLYGSYYIEGIHHLYEFDCGEQSGWMYKVNGWFPNYGCSSYYLEDGDNIVWCYTCKGLGTDVGASGW